MSEQKQTGGIVRATWINPPVGGGPAREVTLEVGHSDGTMTLLVVPVLRQSERFKPAGRP